MNPAQPVAALDAFRRLLPLPDSEPAYLALARSIRHLVMDGKVGLGARLPSERTLAVTLGLSRTTITGAYRHLVDSGWASARQGSGTVVRIPARDRAPSLPLVPGLQTDAIDLSAAAGLAPAGAAALVSRALEWLPRSLAGAGYEPFGAAHLRERIAAWFVTRGVPTEPDQVLVTPGALAGLSVVLHTLASPGSRVLIDSPTYPGALSVAESVRARPASVPIQEAGWDLDAWATALKRGPVVAAYLIPDFHNPTGHLMADGQRAALAALLARSGTTPIVDETLVGLNLDGGPLPTPWAAIDDRAITLGSLSKVLWGGIRIGWVRYPAELMEAIQTRQLQLSLGASALDQLVATTYLENPEPILGEVLGRMRAARDAWLDQLNRNLPDWRADRPRGGLSLWVELPEPASTELALSATGHGLIVAPGARFSADRTQASRIRLPLTLPPNAIVDAVRRLAASWQDVRDGVPSATDDVPALAL